METGIDLDYLYEQIDALGTSMVNSDCPRVMCAIMLSDISRYVNTFRRQTDAIDVDDYHVTVQDFPRTGCS